MVSAAALQTNINIPTAHKYYFTDYFEQEFATSKWLGLYFAFKYDKVNDGLADSVNYPFYMRLDIFNSDHDVYCSLIIDLIKTTTADVSQARYQFYHSGGWSTGSYQNINSNNDDIYYVRLLFTRLTLPYFTGIIQMASDRNFTSLVINQTFSNYQYANYDGKVPSEWRGTLWQKSTDTDNYSTLTVFPIYVVGKGNLFSNQINTVYPCDENLMLIDQDIEAIPLDAFACGGNKLVPKESVMVDRYQEYFDPASPPTTGTKNKVTSTYFNDFNSYTGDLSTKMSSSWSFPAYVPKHVKIGKILNVDLSAPVNTVLDTVAGAGNNNLLGFDKILDNFLTYFVGLINSGGKFMDATRLSLKAALEVPGNQTAVIGWFRANITPAIAQKLVDEKSNIMTWLETNFVGPVATMLQSKINTNKAVWTEQLADLFVLVFTYLESQNTNVHFDQCTEIFVKTAFKHVKKMVED